MTHIIHPRNKQPPEPGLDVGWMLAGGWEAKRENTSEWTGLQPLVLAWRCSRTHMYEGRIGLCFRNILAQKTCIIQS